MLSWIAYYGNLNLILFAFFYIVYRKVHLAAGGHC